MFLKRIWQDTQELARIAHGGTGPKEILNAILKTDPYLIVFIRRLREQMVGLPLRVISHALWVIQAGIAGIALSNNGEIDSGIYFGRPVAVGESAIVKPRTKVKE